MKNSMADYQLFLRGNGLSENTISSYIRSVGAFFSRYDRMDRKNLEDYRSYLASHYAPKTANLRILGINRYLSSQGRDDLRLAPVRVQQKNFIDGILSENDYQLLKKRLREDGALQWYFIVWGMGATGARLSELLKVKAEDIKAGWTDIHVKGGRLRRIHLPRRFREETAQWLRSEGVSSGYVFRNRNGKPFTAQSIALQLVPIAGRYGIDGKTVTPEAFRCLFARKFMEKEDDLLLLTELMGNESLEATRLYLRQTSDEQMEVVDRVVTW